MILVRTPLRVSLFGGGSDIPSFYNNYDGAVLSTAIDKYMYTALCKTSYEGIKVVYNNIETTTNVNKVKHTRVRECLKHFNITTNIEISSFAEIPTKGTGLGSSSTFTVGLVNALAQQTGQQLSQHDIAEIACEIEIDRCGEPIGKQDQYAAAFGGFNLIHFSKNGVTVAKPAISSYTLNRLNNNLLMFYTGITRNTSDILRPISDNNTSDHYVRVNSMVDQVGKALNYLINDDVDSVGDLLNEAWHLKREMGEGVTNELIDKYYQIAMGAGAYGGKVLGAGGGGFLLFYVPDHLKHSVRSAMADHLKEFEFKFEPTGSTVVYNER